MATKDWFPKIRGTFFTLFQIGKGGPNLKVNGTALETRNNADSAYAAHRVAAFDQLNDAVNARSLHDHGPQNPNDIGVHCLGDLMYYPSGGSPQSTNEVQYTRVYLTAGIVITSMRVYIFSGANGARQLQLGVYDQATPSSSSGVPNNQVASTAADAPGAGVNGSFRTIALGSSYTVPTTGYYWLALQCDNGVMQFAISNIFRAGYLPRRTNTPGTFNLPSPGAGATTNPSSAVIFAAAVE